MAERSSNGMHEVQARAFVLPAFLGQSGPQSPVLADLIYVEEAIFRRKHSLRKLAPENQIEA